MALSIGGDAPMPEEGAEMAPDAGAGALAIEAVLQRCKAGDYEGAYQAFLDLLMAADDEIGPGSGGDEMAPDEPAFPPG